jgi:hypothetical protein
VRCYTSHEIPRTDTRAQTTTDATAEARKVLTIEIDYLDEMISRKAVSSQLITPAKLIVTISPEMTARPHRDISVER